METTKCKIVYIAASLALKSQAKALREVLTHHSGTPVLCNSSWIDDPDATVQGEKALDANEHKEIAARCFAEVKEADELVLVWGGPSDRIGSVAETFYAQGLGKPVWIYRPSGGEVVPPLMSLLPELPDDILWCASLALASAIPVSSHPFMVEKLAGLQHDRRTCTCGACARFRWITRGRSST